MFASSTKKEALPSQLHLEIGGGVGARKPFCTLLAEQDHPGVHEDILYEFHIRLGHQSYANIEELASKPESGIKLTDHEKPHYITCTEGKQT